MSKCAFCKRRNPIRYVFGNPICGVCTHRMMLRGETLPAAIKRCLERGHRRLVFPYYKEVSTHVQ